MKRSVRRKLLFVIALFVLALAVRLIYLLQIRNSPMFDTLTMCAEYHDQWAQMILQGEDLHEGVFFRAPLYAYFLASVYKILGHGYNWSRLIQFLIGSLSCILIYILGKRVFNDRTGRMESCATRFCQFDATRFSVAIGAAKDRFRGVIRPRVKIGSQNWGSPLKPFPSCAIFAAQLSRKMPRVASRAAPPLLWSPEARV